MDIIVEIAFVKMVEISCFTGAGEVENGKKPDDFIPSSRKPYGQCGVKSPFWCDVCYLIDLGRPTGDDTTNANHIPARTADKKWL